MTPSETTSPDVSDSSGADRLLRIVLAGDSTVTDTAGWASGFKKRLASTVECINLARGGRSSKSFRDEGTWDQVLESHPDLVLIQFGHNDQPGKGPDRETDPDTTYSRNIATYVDEVRAIFAIPVLVTSLPRRKFDAQSRFEPDALLGYAQATRKVAAEKRVPLIELYDEGVELIERIGPQACTAFDLPELRGKDSTHLGPEGSDVFGEIVARQLARLIPALQEHITVS